MSPWTKNPGSDPPTRTCGSCKLCCLLLDVPEVEAPAGTWCRHCDKTAAGGGCTIYRDPSKPAICDTFQCLWIHGLGTDEQRPDMIGGVFTPQPGGPAVRRYHRAGAGLIGFTARPRTKIGAGVRRLIESMRRSGFAVVVIPADGGKRTLLPATDDPRRMRLGGGP